MHGRLMIALATTGLLGFVACTPSDEEIEASGAQPLANELSLWDATTTPARVDVADGAAVEVGVRFKVDVAGSLAGVRFFKSRANTGPHTAHLWSNGGQLLASATFTNETASGWQTVRFASPVALAAGTYVASYHTAVGHYSGDNGYFRRRSVDRGALHGVADGSGGANGVYRYGASAFPNGTYRSTNYWVDVLFAPGGTTTPADAGTPPVDSGTPPADGGTTTDSGTVPPPPTGPCSGTPNTPGGSDGNGGCFPGPDNTGVPAGTTLTSYTGPCIVTTPNTVIDGKTIACGLQIRTTGVMIKNSRVLGTVSGGDSGSFTIVDSEVQMGRADQNGLTGIGSANFTAIRVEVTGGNRSILCEHNCTVQDSWVHGQNIISEVRLHASGIRQSQGSTLIHNSITCDVGDTPSGGGCSAGLTGYGDFEPVKNNRIERNLFVESTGGACAYGGASGDDGSKPYGAQSENIVFTGNVFQRGRSGKCGFYFPITDFDSSRPGNSWTSNRWNDGTVVPPAN